MVSLSGFLMTSSDGQFQLLQLTRGLQPCCKLHAFHWSSLSCKEMYILTRPDTMPRYYRYKNTDLEYYQDIVRILWEYWHYYENTDMDTTRILHTATRIPSLDTTHDIENTHDQDRVIQNCLWAVGKHQTLEHRAASHNISLFPLSVEEGGKAANSMVAQ